MSSIIVNCQEASRGFEPLNEGFADPCLTTWPRHRAGTSLLDTTSPRGYAAVGLLAHIPADGRKRILLACSRRAFAGRRRWIANDHADGGAAADAGVIRADGSCAAGRLAQTADVPGTAVCFLVTEIFAPAVGWAAARCRHATKTTTRPAAGHPVKLTGAITATGDGRAGAVAGPIAERGDIGVELGLLDRAHRLGYGRHEGAVGSRLAL